MKILFAKLKSRLGLYNNPNGQSDKNAGVESAPDYVLSKSLLQTIQDYQIDIIEQIFPAPEFVQKNEYLITNYSETKKLSQSIQSKINKEDILISIGGDHGCVLGSMHAISELYGSDQVGYIQIDSHADIHLVKSSPSGNFHGMYMRAVFDSFDFSPLNTLFMKKAKTKQLFYIGNLDIELSEQEFINTHSIRVIDRTELLMKNMQILEELQLFCNQFEHIHVSFDVDAIDKSQVQATGIPAENGLLSEEVFPIIQQIRMYAKTRSLDVVEVNPLKKGSPETIKIAQEVIKRFL